MFVNKTPHEVTLIKATGGTIVLPPCPKEEVTRVRHSDSVVDEHLGVEILDSPLYQGIENVPEVKYGTFYVVSRMAKDHLPMRKDLVVPALLVRNGHGEIIGCRAVAL